MSVKDAIRERFFDTREIGPRNAQFRAEAERFALRFRCEHCVHVEMPAVRCTLGYPNDVLSGEPVTAVLDDGSLAFCKDFELGAQG